MVPSSLWAILCEGVSAQGLGLVFWFWSSHGLCPSFCFQGLVFEVVVLSLRVPG